VDDLVEALILMMQSPKGFTGPVNLGNPEEFTVMELAQSIIKLTGSKSKIVRKELPKDDPERRRPDISLAKSALNWSPKVQLEEGLTKTIGFFEDLLRRGSSTGR
jgi:UDP-glucuronate decarboxylase